MILSCPTCATRYRHEHLPVGSPARCGQCDRVFPVPPSRSYFVQAISPAGRTLVAANAGAMQSAGARQVLIEDLGTAPVRVALGREVSLPPMPGGPEEPVSESSFELAAPRPGRPTEEPKSAGSRSTATMPTVPLDRRAAPRREVAPPEPEKATFRSTAGVLLAWIALGAGMGLALSFVLGGPMRIWSAAGVATGLVAGWGWLRWMSGRS